MKNLLVKDTSIEEIIGNKYDLAIFACGYEARCIHAPKTINNKQIKETLVIGFDEVKNCEQRNINSEYYLDNWTKGINNMSADDEGGLYPLLNGSFNKKRESIRILVDYSSMSRLWYAGILNWSRYITIAKTIEIDFLYSNGVYDDDIPPIVIDKILSIPGCEGGSIGFGRTVALFGLGFFGIMAQCVYEHIEPDLVYAYLALSPSRPKYDERVKASNGMFINENVDCLLEIPLNSVETILRYQTELALPHMQEKEIVNVPMGPKPHVLAAILLSIKYPKITCLRVNTKRKKPENVMAEGEIVATKVIFTSDDR